MSDVPQPEDPDRPEEPSGSSPVGGGSPVPEAGGLPFPGSGGLPFPGAGGLPFDLGNLDVSSLMGMLHSVGPVNWEVARQVADAASQAEGPAPEIAAADREQLEELARAAQTLVVAETGLASTFSVDVRMLTPRDWARLHLDALRPVLEALATTIGRAMESADADLAAEELPPGALPEGLQGFEMLAGMLGVLAPLLLGVQAGSLVGYLAQHALGRYDLPLPAADAPSLGFVVANIDAFESAWELRREDLRFYLAIHEVVHAAQRSVPWVRERLVALAREYVVGYDFDNAALEEQLGSFDPSDPASIGRLTEHPEQLLGAMRSDAQREVVARFQVFTATLEGYADSVIERISTRLIPSFAQIHEAMKRHRLERGEAERFVEGLLGLKLDREHYERGDRFAAGVVERAGADGLNRLWTDPRLLPTPAELDAPGLWLARIDLPEQ
ncbi:MAG: zinc-dependent metalloprotease [Acidimicrobiia bacterium]